MCDKKTYKARCDVGTGGVDVQRAKLQGSKPHLLSVPSWSLLAVSLAVNGKAVLVFNVNYHRLDTLPE